MISSLTTILTCSSSMPRWEVSLTDADEPTDHRHVLVQDERSGIGFVGSVTTLSAFADSLMKAAAIGADKLLTERRPRQ